MRRQWTEYADQAEKALSAFLSFLQQPRAKTAGMALAAILFIGGIALSVAADPNQFLNLQLGPLALVLFVASPLMIVANAAEFLFLAKLVGRPTNAGAALKVTVIGSAANLLPLPGGALVRVAALKTAGASVAGGAGGAVLAAVIWVGVSFMLGGAAALALGLPIAGGLGLVAGGVVLAGAFVAAHVAFGDAPAALGITAVKIVATLIDAVRLYWCLAALGVGANLLQGTVLSVSGVIGAAVAIAPAGLGVREGTAALLAGFIALPAASAFLAASLARLLGLVALAPLALYLAAGEAKTARMASSSIDPS